MYKNVWMAFADIKAMDGNRFKDLIDPENQEKEEYFGAWASILVVNERINEVADIIEAKLNELGMTVKFIEKIVNVELLVDYNDIDEDIIQEIHWLSESDYIFKIADKLYPYSEE